MIPLTQIQVETPCHADWNGMAGDDQRRFCPQCRKHVHHLSMLSRPEAEALLAQTDGQVCVRFRPGPDGTPLTRDDLTRFAQPTGRRLSAAVWLLAAALAGLSSGCAPSSPAVSGGPSLPTFQEVVSRLFPFLSPPAMIMGGSRVVMGAPLAPPIVGARSSATASRPKIRRPGARPAASRHAKRRHRVNPSGHGGN